VTPALNDSFLNCLTLEQLESSLECVGTVLSVVVASMRWWSWRVTHVTDLSCDCLYNQWNLATTGQITLAVRQCTVTQWYINLFYDTVHIEMMMRCIMEIGARWLGGPAINECNISEWVSGCWCLYLSPASCCCCCCISLLLIAGCSPTPDTYSHHPSSPHPSCAHYWCTVAYSERVADWRVV